MLSQQLRNYLRCPTRDERALLEEALRIRIPLVVANVGALTEGRLLGGMVEDEAKALVTGLLKCAFEIVVHGNKKEIDSQLDASIQVAAEMEVNGQRVQGTHKGDRIRGGGERSYASMGMKHYRLIASGDGEFNSKDVYYRGKFWNNLFHDHTGKAELFVSSKLKYLGCFSEGKRNGPGTLSLYDAKTAVFFDYFAGDWQDDMPWNGYFFSASDRSHPVARVENGVHCVLSDGHFDFGKAETCCEGGRGYCAEEISSLSLSPSVAEVVHLPLPPRALSSQSSPLPAVAIKALPASTTTMMSPLPVNPIPTFEQTPDKESAQHHAYSASTMHERR